MYRGRELFLVYKNMVEILDAISHKLSGQYDRFIAWFGTVFLQHGLDGFDLQHGLDWF